MMLLLKGNTMAIARKKSLLKQKKDNIEITSQQISNIVESAESVSLPSKKISKKKSITNNPVPDVVVKPIKCKKKNLLKEENSISEPCSDTINIYIKTPHTILGIDPGLTKTGWGVISVGARGGLSYVDHGVIKPKAGECISVRLLHIYKGLEVVIAKHSPDRACVEEVFVNMCNPMSALKLGAARGMALLVISKNNLKLHECSPTVLKKSIAGHGHAKKEEVQQKVRQILKIKKDLVLQEDASDALAIALELARR
jgi:crossover junction endodeoxyribonuclease RuvC